MAKPGRTGGGTKNLTIAWFLLIGGASIYGGVFSANKLVAEAGVPFIAFTFWQAFLGGIFLLGISFATRKLPQVTIPHLRSYVVTALLGLVVPLLLLTFIGNKLPAGIITLAYTLIPGMTFLFAVVIGLDRLRWLSIGGLFLGLVGVFLLLIPKGSLPNDDSTIWLLISLVLPIIFATNNVYIAIVEPPAATALTRATGLLLTAAIFTFPIMLISDGLYFFWQAPDITPWMILWTGVINMVSYFCMFEIIRRAGAIFFGQYNYVIVIAGVLWSLMIFDENLTFWFWVALFVMLGGLYLGNAGTNQSLREQAE